MKRTYSESELISLMQGFNAQAPEQHAPDYLWCERLSDTYIPRWSAGRKVEVEYHTDADGRLWLMIAPASQSTTN